MRKGTRLSPSLTVCHHHVGGRAWEWGYAELAENHWPGICSNTESTMDDKASPGLQSSTHTDCIPIQRSWVMIMFAAKCSVYMLTSEENGATNEAIILQWLAQNALWDFKVVKKWWAGALLSVTCCCLVRKPEFP